MDATLRGAVHGTTAYDCFHKADALCLEYFGQNAYEITALEARDVLIPHGHLFEAVFVARQTA